MKLETATREAESTGFMEEKSFSIAANGKAFRILIDKMYSNVHQAIVRELMTNAWDAHILVGNLKPFEIHVPTSFEPYFSIRDFGCAMSHDQVMNVYSTIFESTKDARDDQVGAWGLGSKTPFAYTDTFGVQVWQLGRHRVYNVFIDTTGVPKIALALDEENDGAADGVEISFPVAAKDSGLFRNALENVCIGFDPRPKLSSQLNVPDLVIRQSGNKWFTFDSTRHSWLNQPLARTGCVLYPIDFSSVCDYIESNKLNLDFYELLTEGQGFRQSRMVVDFPIGAIEVTANREGLYYSTKTCKAIIERFTEILADMKAHVDKIIKNGKTLYEVNLEVYKACHSFDALGANVSTYLYKYASERRFKGREILKMISFNHRRVTFEIGKDPTSGNTIFQSRATRYTTLEYLHYPASKFQRSLGIKFAPVDSFTWKPAPTDVYVELPLKGGKRVSYAAARIKAERNKRGTTLKHDLIWIKTPSLTDKNFIRMMVGLGRPPYTIINDLDKPDSIVLERNVAPLRYLDLSRNEWKTFNDFDIENDAGLYIMLSNGVPAEMRHSDITNLVNFLVRQGAIVNPGAIIGIPKSRKAVLNKSTEWKELRPILQDAYRKLIDPKQAAIQYSLNENRLDSGITKNIEILHKNIGRKALNSFAPDSPFIKAAEARTRLIEIEKTAKEFSEIWQLRFVLDFQETHELEEKHAELAKIDPALDDEIKNLTATISAIEVAYPLLSSIYSMSSHVPELADYMLALDLIKKVRADKESDHSQISLDIS